MTNKNAQLAIDYWTAVRDGKKVEWRIGPNFEWVRSSRPRFDDRDHDYEIRITEPTILVNGVEVPAPVRRPLERGQWYFVADPRDKDGYGSFFWRNDAIDHQWLAYGLIHLTAEAAVIHGKAMRAASEVKS